MPLIKCNVCENTISANAEICPHCGEKYLKFSRIVICRTAAFSGFAVGMDIIIDGILTKSLRTNESITLELTAGLHFITASAHNGWNSSMPLMVVPTKAYSIDVNFKPFGVNFQINASEVQIVLNEVP
ncbi:MAG: hypothetical protein HYZ25_17925 [Chloroflexi bacterium]|nr:hypothetical protein [Chloroflexota bacterium]